MPSTPSQKQRFAQLRTPLGDDKLLLTRFDAQEGLSQLLDMSVDCISQDKAVDLAALIGQTASIKCTLEGGSERFFTGTVIEARRKGYVRPDDFYDYELRVRAWPWLLSQARDSRIFQNLSVPDIIKKVFDQAGFSGRYKFNLSETYKPREYCVQYEETHLDFVSRLMEEEGIFYYFEYADNDHTLKIVDAKSAHENAPGVSTIAFLDRDSTIPTDVQWLSDWASERRFRTGKVTVKAYDFDKPSSELKLEKSAPGGYTSDQMEMFFYPKTYQVKHRGDLDEKYAKAVLEGAQAQDRRRYAGGRAPGLIAGFKTSVTGTKGGKESDDKEYVVVSARHMFVAEAYASVPQSSEDDPYRGQYVLLPSSEQFRAPIVTPKPVIYGPQTALVVGPAGEEIYTDKYGRVKLQFHWDREGKKDENSSRWARVSQMWSGKNWGGFYVPRIGMEAVVEFIGGDPERPLVVGTVYNAENMMPETMPDNKTRHGMKTRSSSGGDANTYNELVFEDKKSEEFVRFNAEKDLNSTIENQETRLIKAKAMKGKNARQTTIEQGNDDLVLSSGDAVTTITGKKTVTATNDILIKSDTKITLQVGGTTTIEMTPAGIKITTPDLKITTTAQTVIDGGGFITQTAGLIKLN